MLLLGLLLVASGCSKCESKPTPTVASAEVTPDPITHPCMVTATQYDMAVSKGSDACQSDADCGCYQGGIGKTGCGGVLSKDSVAKAEVLAKRYHEMKCPLTTQCAAWACQPKCIGGRCRP